MNKYEAKLFENMGKKIDELQIELKEEKQRSKDYWEMYREKEKALKEAKESKAALKQMGGLLTAGQKKKLIALQSVDGES